MQRRRFEDPDIPVGPKRGRGGSAKGRERKHLACEPCRDRKIKCTSV